MTEFVKGERIKLSAKAHHPPPARSVMPVFPQAKPKREEVMQIDNGRSSQGQSSVDKSPPVAKTTQPGAQLHTEPRPMAFDASPATILPANHPEPSSPMSKRQGPLATLDLRDGQCRWPSGEGETLRYCCGTTELGRPYCEIHRRQGVTEERRR